MYRIKGRELKWLCHSHGIQYGKQKAPNKKTGMVGICDICELETKGAQQTVLSVEDYQGIILADADGLITLQKK